MSDTLSIGHFITTPPPRSVSLCIFRGEHLSFSFSTRRGRARLIPSCAVCKSYIAEKLRSQTKTKPRVQREWLYAALMNGPAEGLVEKGVQVHMQKKKSELILLSV